MRNLPFIHRVLIAIFFVSLAGQPLAELPPHCDTETGILAISADSALQVVDAGHDGHGSHSGHDSHHGYDSHAGMHAMHSEHGGDIPDNGAMDCCAEECQCPPNACTSLFPLHSKAALLSSVTTPDIPQSPTVQQQSGFPKTPYRPPIFA